MALLIAGIDEAGYGPTLGPLCVAMAVLRVESWAPGDPAPDLWTLLAPAVCRAPKDARKRIPIADSKALKLPNDVKGRDPLCHLERGVLSFLRGAGRLGSPIRDDDLLRALGAAWPGSPWYAGGGVAMPLSCTEGQLSIDASRLGAAMEPAGVTLERLAVTVVDERAFNDVVRRTGTKAEATALAMGAHVRALWEGWAAEPAGATHLRIVCDQLGGRTRYDGLLARELPGVGVTRLSEGEDRSRYGLSAEPGGEGPPRAIAQFMPEAEAAHLPVALASMAAKLVRELAMRRFNAYWCARVPELKPTAGYAADARRWLEELRGVLGPAEREALVRIA